MYYINLYKLSRQISVIIPRSTRNSTLIHASSSNILNRIFLLHTYCFKTSCSDVTDREIFRLWRHRSENILLWRHRRSYSVLILVHCGIKSIKTPSNSDRTKYRIYFPRLRLGKYILYFVLSSLEGVFIHYKNNQNHPFLPRYAQSTRDTKIF